MYNAGRYADAAAAGARCHAAAADERAGQRRSCLAERREKPAPTERLLGADRWAGGHSRLTGL